MGAVEIVPVERRAELRAFVDLPWSIYASEPNWVPPLKSDVRHLLDTRRHPFWKFAKRALFLAQRGGRTIGRIAAIVDHNYNRFHDERMGIWGFFECVDDAAASSALFDAAAAWVKDRGMTFFRGPLNPSTNYDVGLLVDGFQYPPVVMMPYNLPHYERLVTGAGFQKEKDLISFFIGEEQFPTERTERLAKVITKKHGISVRCADFKRFDGEMAIIKDIYHASWERNWGFVPMTDEEIDEMGRNLMRFADPDLVFFVYRGEEPAGVAVVLPDVNPMLKLLNGRIGPIGLLKVFRHRHDKRAFRGTVFGFKEQYRKLGLPLVAFDYTNRVLRDPRKRTAFLELGWNLEDNRDINQFDSDVGGQVYKRYRIYRKEL